MLAILDHVHLHRVDVDADVLADPFQQLELQQRPVVRAGAVCALLGGDAAPAVLGGGGGVLFVLEGEGSYRLPASAWPEQAGAARPSGSATEMSSTSCSPSLTTSTFTASTSTLTYLRITSSSSRCSSGR